jgi:hypothetical protein
VYSFPFPCSNTIPFERFKKFGTGMIFQFFRCC